MNCKLAQFIVLLGALALGSTAALAEEKLTRTKIDLEAIQGNPVVAKVNGSEIKVSEVIQFIQTMPKQFLKKIPLEILFATARDQLIDSHVAKEAALKQKEQLEKNPEVKESIENAINAVIVQAYMEEVIENKVTAKAVKARFQKLLDKFPKKTHETRVRLIIVKTEKAANEIIQSLEEGIDFLKLAREKSTDKNFAQKDGDLGYLNVLQKKDLPPEFGVVFEKDAKDQYVLKTSKYTKKPLAIKAGDTVISYVILKVEDRKPFNPPKFTEIKAELRKGLATEVKQKHIAELQKTRKIVRLHPNTGKPVGSLEDEIKALQKAAQTANEKPAQK